ncbi:MAG: thioesterase family protein [Gammaproteobacteria bacterium]|nr:thioesterase family protein [Gammaproteobacteria bacterium]MCP5197745.1 thioesterase family protein [Gammaproteobacteria bacterium]
MRIESPLCLYTGIVPPEWIDYNGHMNVAYYVLAFDHATDAFMDYLSLDQSYRESQQCSAFVVESHINYQRELMAGDPMRITTQLLGFDSKRIHYFHRLYHAKRGFLSATTELMVIHVDLTERRSARMPLAVLDRLNAVMTQHIQLSRPLQSGRVIGVRAKSAVAGIATITPSLALAQGHR